MKIIKRAILGGKSILEPDGEVVIPVVDCSSNATLQRLSLIGGTPCIQPKCCLMEVSTACDGQRLFLSPYSIQYVREGLQSFIHLNIVCFHYAFGIDSVA